MDEKLLGNIKIVKESRSYIDCLYALLSSAELFDLPKYMLAGMTGMAFKFSIHKRLLPSSLDLYNWRWENWRAVNTLGIYNETYTGSPMDSTFPIYQKNLVKKIRQSIDEGKAVLGWGPTKSSFCLLFGYSDQDQVLFFRHNNSKEDEVMLYDNLGLIEEGDWFLQIIGDKAEKDVRDIYRDSMEIAVSEWNSKYRANAGYGSGKNAYLNLISSLKAGDFEEQGVFYILGAYMNSKREASMYMNEVAAEIPALIHAAKQYKKLTDTYDRIRSIPFTKRYKEDMNHIPQILEIFGEAMQIEEHAIGEIEKYMDEIMSNKQINPVRLKVL